MRVRVRVEERWVFEQCLRRHYCVDAGVCKAGMHVGQRLDTAVSDDGERRHPRLDARDRVPTDLARVLAGLNACSAVHCERTDT